MKEILTLYRDRLTDLTAANKSLKLMRLTNKNHFDIGAFSKIEEELGANVLDRICSLNNQIPLIPINSLEEEVIIANRKLTQLKREVDLIEQETGKNPFYVAYGFLEGFLVPNFYLRCPILFYPARLIKSRHMNKPYWVMDISEEDSPFINRTFLMALQTYLGGDIKKQVDEELSALPKSREDVIPFLYDLLRKYDISLTAEKTKELLIFKNMKKVDIPNEKIGFDLVPYAVMGKFQQSTSTLLNDYNFLLDNLPEEGLIKRLLGDDEDNNDKESEIISADNLDTIHPSENHFVLDTDASQEAVVIASRENNGLIVHGPPGTGKSQVIVNLIVDRLMRGQRVLLVCQKPAALDVVYNRLGQINLQGHVALVHDFSKNKVDVYSRIASVIDKSPSRSSKDLTRLNNEKHSLAKKLNNIAESLHKERPFGKTLHYLYSKAKWDQNFIIDAEDLIEGKTYDDLQESLIDLRTIVTLMDKYDQPNYPWSKRKSFAQFNSKDQLELKNILDPLVNLTRKGYDLRNKTKLLFEPKYYLENKEALIELEESLRMLENRLLHKHIQMFFRDETRDFENEEQLTKVINVFGSLKNQLNVLNTKAEPIDYLSPEEARSWYDKINQFQYLNKKITRFVNTTWYNFRKQIQEHCIKVGISFDGNSVREYSEKIESFLLFEKLRATAKDLYFFSDVPVINNYDDWEKWILAKERTLRFLQAFVNAQVVFPKWLINPDKVEILEKFAEDDFQGNIRSLIEITDITKKLQERLENLKKFLIDEFTNELKIDIEKGIYNFSVYESLHETIESFVSICRLDQLKQELNELHTKLIYRCNEKIPLGSISNSVELWLQLIENSFMHEWIIKVESEEPFVKDISTEIYRENIDRYRSLLKEKRKVVPEILDYKLGVQSAEVQGATLKKIKHESNKKRKLLPLRQVVGHFYDDLLRLVPCWLCTPDSVSAIFPMKQDLFDLVIFDEASQCPVENSIPAIYRGKQVVVAGDEKQLPPSSFFQSSADDEDEDEDEDNNTYVDRTDKQAKSLLEWSKPKFQEQWLSWHYRSQFEELINFSNYAFYDKRIQIAPTVVSNSKKPIEFISVDGKWVNRSNRIEAEKIVDVVLDILKNEETRPTLGVITFNKQQADLINDVFEERVSKEPEIQYLIEEARNRKQGEENMGLFVKNIENVQGDERDIILFSVGYAQDVHGKMVSQFGPLSRDGGENRLNVAITRAKTKVYIVCSFDPSTWHRVETYARGVRLLKRYLEYGKAVSDGDKALVKSLLDGLLDSTNVSDQNNHVFFDSDFEVEVYQELKSRGYNVDTQVGCSGYRIDLAIVNPVTHDRYILGVECDGAMYHSSKTARDRDIYRQRFLESKGWNIHRIWSRDWWISKDREVEKIEQRIDQILNQLPVVNR